MPKYGAGTLRAAGVTAVAVDKPTRAKLKALAGDMPLSHWLRGIAFGTIEPPRGGAQEPLPGQERAGSPATIHAVAAKMSALDENSALLLVIATAIADKLGIRINTGLRDKFKTLARSVAGPEDSQSELKLE